MSHRKGKVWKIICYLKSAFKKGGGDLLVFRRVSFCPRLNRWVSIFFPKQKTPHETSIHRNSARKNPVTFFRVVPWWNFRNDPTRPELEIVTSNPTIAWMRWWCFWTQKLDPREVDFWPPNLSPIMVQWKIGPLKLKRKGILEIHL